MRKALALGLVVLAAGCGDDADAGPPRGACPPRMVQVGRFCMDRHEADDRGMPANGTVPARRISFDDANAACRALGYRLCTGEEWTRACAGPAGTRKFPYGDSYERGRCNTAEPETELRDRIPRPGGSRPRCASPEGVLDLSGNVWEWTDEADTTGTLRELRGGSFAISADNAMCANDDRSFQPLDAAFDGYGFRCCTRARDR